MGCPIWIKLSINDLYVILFGVHDFFKSERREGHRHATDKVTWQVRVHHEQVGHLEDKERLVKVCVALLCHKLSYYFTFLGALTKLQKKKTIGFIMSVLSIHMEQFGSHWIYFREILYYSIFRKFCPENSSFIKIWQK